MAAFLFRLLARHGRSVGLRIALAGCLCLAWSGQAAGLTRPGEIERLTRRLAAAQEQFAATPTNLLPALALGRACFELAEFATNSTQRAALAEQGIAACHRALSLSPTNAAAYCALGLNLGQLARTRTLGALKLVPQIEAAWLAAATSDPQVNHAAPHRLLAMLYDGAPGWPLSIGSSAAARTNFQQAVRLAPDYADNWLVYLEACLGWSDLQTARSLVTPAAAAMAKAPQLFPGTDWAWELQDWQQRWTAAQKRLAAAEQRARNAKNHQLMKSD